MQTWLKKERSIATQAVMPFTGEGAYHGSTKQKPAPAAQVARVPVSEARPTTLERYVVDGVGSIGMFDAVFPNKLGTVAQLSVPSQDAVRDDGVTFCWCPFDEAEREAGPVTRNVLRAMERGISGFKRYVYVDSKIQYFEPGDLPVDSCLRHVDGTIAVRDERVRRYGATVLHDMRARIKHDSPPEFMAYQSSDHCATGFLTTPIQLRIPELLPNFNAFDAAVRSTEASEVAHPAGAILAYDGLTVHWATPATSSGWRLWVRCTQTDVEITPTESVIACYGTVFRPRR